jgi:hypothetical protein
MCATPSRFQASDQIFRVARVGAATNTDEYVPVNIPINSAIANSLKVDAPSTPAPIIKSETTGSIDEIDVLAERIIT